MGLKKEEVWTKTFVYVVYFAFYFLNSLQLIIKYTSKINISILTII